MMLRRRDGAFFRLNDYIDRFFASMAALQLNPNMAKQQVQDALIDMAAASAMRESYVAMVCSRGVLKIAGSRDPRDCRNHFYAWCVRCCWQSGGCGEYRHPD
jgi:branched-chain amino acid aminotransferase